MVEGLSANVFRACGSACVIEISRIFFRAS